MELPQFRAQFPVLERLAYLNAGTDGPVPRRAAEAASDRIRSELADGRSGKAHFEQIMAGAASLRERLARLFACSVDDVALTRSTTDGVATVLSALALGSGDEVLTSDEEHPGLLAPLEGARRRRGFDVRHVPFAAIAGEVSSRTKLVACSHVSWVSGRVVDHAALCASDALVLLDGAQGIGAVPTRVGELGCDFYAASGQKWLCGPDGSGYLYARRAIADELDPPWPGYGSLADPERASDLVVHDGARRFDLGFPPGPATAWANAAFDVLEEAGFEWVWRRAVEGANQLAARLAARGVEIAPRGGSTLVSWRSSDAQSDVDRLAATGIVVRHLPGRGLVRASVGGWTSEEELDRLVAAAA